MRKLIEDADKDLFVSAASMWEIATKVRLGKLPNARTFTSNLVANVVGEAFEQLDVTLAHANRAGSLLGALKDPFDRMLIAQSLLEALHIISIDRAFDEYGVKRLWS